MARDCPKRQEKPARVTYENVEEPDESDEEESEFEETESDSSEEEESDQQDFWSPAAEVHTVGITIGKRR